MCVCAVSSGCTCAVSPGCRADIFTAMAMQLTSITQTPDMLVNKGAEFFRKSNANSGILANRRKSAVELLEASKSEYVKSSSVLNQKQELKHPEVFHVRNPRSQSAVVGNQPARSKSEYGLASSNDRPNSDHSRRISREKTDKSYRTERNNSAKSDSSKKNNDNSELIVSDKALTSSHENKERASHSAEIRRKAMDKPALKEKPAIKEKPTLKEKPALKEKPVVREKPHKREKPFWKEKPSHSKDFLLPTSYQSLSTSVTVLVEKRCASSGMTKQTSDHEVIRRKKKPLHRSQSDLSCRHSRTSSDFSDLSSRLSRTSTELERFFNEMGIDKSVLEPMMRLRDRATKDSDMFESISSVGSASNPRSTCSDLSQDEGKDKDKQETAESDKEIAERNAKETSIVEKNARIIKWLCNVKKARHPDQQAS